MSNSIKAFAALCALVTVTACAQPEPVEEYVIVDPTPPVTAEPVYTGKYN